MERLRLPRLPRLLAAAVIVECCAQLCPALGTGTGSALGTAVPCARPGTATGQRCRTDLEGAAGTGQAPPPEVTGQLRTEAELLPFPGTPAGTDEPPSPQGSPPGPQAGGEGTGPAAQEAAGAKHPGSPLSAGSAEQAAAGSERPSPAHPGVPSVGAAMELDTAPTTRHPPRTDPVGTVTVEGATTPQGTPSHSPSPATVPSSAGGQRGSPSTLLGWGPMGTALVQSQRGSQGPSSPEPWAGGGPGVTVPLGDSSPGTHPSVVPPTDSPAPGTAGTSPFAGGLQRLLTPLGTRQGLPGLAGGGGSDSHPWRGTDVAWQGPRSAPRPSLPPLGAGGPAASTRLAPPAAGTGPTSLPAAGKGSGLPVPTAMASTPEVTSLGLGEALDTTTGVLGPPDTEGPPEHSHVPLDQTWSPSAVPGQPPASVAPGSTAAAQSGVTHTSPGPPRVPPHRQPVPASGSAAPTTPAPQPSPGTSGGGRGLGPAVDTPPAGPSLGNRPPDAGSEGDPAESPQTLGGPREGVSSAEPLSWRPGSPAPTPTPAPPQQPAPSQPVSSLGLTTAATATSPPPTGPLPTATSPPATAPALLGDTGTATPEPGAVLQGDAAGLTWGPPTHLPTRVPGTPPQPPGTLGHWGGPGSLPAAGDTDLARPSSIPGGQPDPDTPRATPAPPGRAPPVFIVEDQPPLLKVPLLRVPCELVLDMGFVPALRDPASPEHRALLRSFDRTVAPLFTSVPGFLRLEVTGVREGSVVLEYDALFAAERVPAELGARLEAALRAAASRPGLAVGAAPVLRIAALERPLEPCAALLACRAGFACVSGGAGNATCTSLCHRGYCKNQGICTHPRDRGPRCQCPVGSDFWFVGLRCDHRVTQQGLLGGAAGVLLSIVLLGAAVAAVAIRRFKALLLEARAEQTRSSYRRFCRLDDVSAQYWSRSRLPSASSLDNPAFSNSEELLHLQALDNGCCGCREDSGITDSAERRPAPPACPPSFHYEWDTSSSSVNDPMVDSGKASDISVSSWPMEPIPWTPFPLLHQLSRQRVHAGRRPRSFCEGTELANLERSWTA